MRFVMLVLWVVALLCPGIVTAAAQATPTPTASSTPSTAPTMTPTMTATATPTPQGSYLILQIAAGGDDVNESGGTFAADQFDLWVGNAGSTSGHYLGLRFTNVPIPPGSVVHAAYLEVYPTTDQWIDLTYDLAAEAADNSVPFSSSDLPSQRELTTAIVNYDSNVLWRANTWQFLGEIAAPVQEVISRPGWQPGNSLTIIAQGTAEGGNFGRKFFSAFENDPLVAVRLIIDLSPGENSSDSQATTQTPTPTASVTLHPCAAILLPARLRVGQSGQVVSAATTPVNVRQAPSIAAPRFGRLEQGTSFAVIGGPTCADGVRWFQIRYGENNAEGWLAEGQNNVYFVEPLE